VFISRDIFRNISNRKRAIALRGEAAGIVNLELLLVAVFAASIAARHLSLLFGKLFYKNNVLGNFNCVLSNMDRQNVMLSFYFELNDVIVKLHARVLGRKVFYYILIFHNFWALVTDTPLERNKRFRKLNHFSLSVKMWGIT
jgi:hypothetical protein